MGQVDSEIPPVLRGADIYLSFNFSLNLSDGSMGKVLHLQFSDEETRAGGRKFTGWWQKHREDPDFLVPSPGVLPLSP